MHFQRWGAAAAVCLTICGCSSTGTAPETKTYSMGDKANAGPLIYNVFDTQWQPQLGAGDKTRVPANRFLLVRLSVVNSGGEESSIPTFTLLGDDGQTWTELSDGEGVDNWIGVVRRIKPAENEQGVIVFDAPPKHYRLKVTDEGQQHAAFIDLPLSFGG